MKNQMKMLKEGQKPKNGKRRSRHNVVIEEPEMIKNETILEREIILPFEEADTDGDTDEDE